MSMTYDDRPVQHTSRPTRAGTPKADRSRKRVSRMAALAWLRRRFRNRPGSTIAHGLFAVAGIAIIVNAIAWQSGATQRSFLGEAQTPAPAAQAVPLPPQRPVDLAGVPAQRSAGAATPSMQPATPQVPAPAAVRPAGTREAPARESSMRDATARESARADQIGDLIRTGMVPGMDAPRPPAPVIERAALNTGNDKPVAAAQRALNKLGFGPVRADGRFGEETRAAIERFERERRIAVTRDLSPRTLRELAQASGIRME